MITLESIAASREVMEKVSGRGRVTAKALENLGFPEAAKKVKRKAESAGDLAERVLFWEIPGTKDIHLLPKKQRDFLSEAIRDNPEIAAIYAAAPVPGAGVAYMTAARKSEKALLDRLSRHGKFRRRPAEVPSRSERLKRLLTGKDPMKTLPPDAVEGFWDELDNIQRSG